MSSRTTTVWEGTRVLARELLREPVKQAVREAIREEAGLVRSDGDVEEPVAAPARAPPAESDSGRSTLTMTVLALVAGIGIAYMLRQRGGGDEYGESWSDTAEGVASEATDTAQEVATEATEAAGMNQDEEEEEEATAGESDD